MTTVKLKEYNIYIGDVWETFKDFLKEGAYLKPLIIVDENTRRDCLPLFLEKSGLKEYVIIDTLSGEINKNLRTCESIWGEMMTAKANRQSLAINLGGGVIGDMGGFCASTFKRGMDFIQVPTTLLSQVDSSIGGKLGIDFGPLKNSIGLFKNPKAVFIDPIFYDTLDPREFRSGFAEVIKHSLIADQEQWKILQNLEQVADFDWQQLLVPSLTIKKRIVEEDPFEKGIRKALNFGHTIGHAIEGDALMKGISLLHGEAIAVGMVCEAWLSYKIAGLAQKDLEEITQFILHHYGRYDFPKLRFPKFLELMRQDKKNETNQINFTMLKSPGEALINQFCSDSLIEDSLHYFLDL